MCEVGKANTAATQRKGHGRITPSTATIFDARIGDWQVEYVSGADWCGEHNTSC